VTQTAEVDVNRASKKEMFSPAVMKGRSSRRVPTVIAKMKLRAKKRAGWNAFSPLILWTPL